MDGGLLFCSVLVSILIVTFFYLAVRRKRSANEPPAPRKPVTVVGVFWAVILALLVFTAATNFVSYCFRAQP
jgi:heme/copper-type cytochrome/quinol oxidase subunit 2